MRQVTSKNDILCRKPMYNIKNSGKKIFAWEEIPSSREQERLAGLGRIHGKPLSRGPG